MRSSDGVFADVDSSAVGYDFACGKRLGATMAKRYMAKRYNGKHKSTLIKASVSQKTLTTAVTISIVQRIINIISQQKSIQGKALSNAATGAYMEGYKGRGSKSCRSKVSSTGNWEGGGSNCRSNGGGHELCRRNKIQPQMKIAQHYKEKFILLTMSRNVQP